MHWQDVTMMVVGFMFALFLLPSIRGKEKPAKLSCITTASGMAVVTLCVATLGLWLTTVSYSLTTIAWIILAVQRRSACKI